MHNLFARARLRREASAPVPDESRMSLADIEALLREIAAVRTDRTAFEEAKLQRPARVDSVPRAPKLMS